MESHEFKSLRGMRVLVVDDNAISRRLICYILTQWQVSTDEAANGIQALELMKQNIYHVVLMDLMMPDMDGYEATMALRAMEGDYYQKLPILAFSASPDMERIKECGMTGIVNKTISDKIELYQSISNYAKHTLQSDSTPLISHN
jgi:CheY-like chemotaxis protein